MAELFSMTVDASQVVNLAEAWQTAPDMVAEELTRAIWEGELLLQREVQEGTPVGVTSLLKQSIAAQDPQRVDYGVLGVVGTAISYAAPVEFGSRPHFPPIKPLADWAHYKLGISIEEAEHVAYAIARKIAAQGTKGAFMFTNAAKAMQPQITRIMIAGLQRIAERLAEGASS